MASRTLVRGRSRAERKELAVVRAWARENGFQVNDTGRMPDEVHVAYRVAHGGADVAATPDDQHHRHEEHPDDHREDHFGPEGEHLGDGA